MRHTLNMILGYSAAPLRMVTYFGLLVGAIGILLAVRTLWLYFEGATTVAGFTTVATMVAIFSSAQMVGIGMLGEYLGRIHFRGMGRPSYVVRADSRARVVSNLPEQQHATAPIRQAMTR